MSNRGDITEFEGAIGTLLDNISSDWSDDEIKHARDDIHYGEYGLAIELIAATLARDSKPITPEIFTRVVALFHQTNSENSDYLIEFRNYATELGIGPSAAPHAADPDSNL